MISDKNSESTLLFCLTLLFGSTCYAASPSAPIISGPNASVGGVSLDGIRNQLKKVTPCGILFTL